MIRHLGDDFVELLLDRTDQRFDARPHSSPPHQQELPLRDEHCDHDRRPHNASEIAPPSQDTGELGEHARIDAVGFRRPWTWQNRALAAD
jgi:hypothetical protein